MYFGILDWNLWFCDLKCVLRNHVHPILFRQLFMVAEMTYGGVMVEHQSSKILHNQSSPVFQWWCGSIDDHLGAIEEERGQRGGGQYDDVLKLVT